MSVATSHQISRYYDFHRDKEIVFTKANLKSLRINPRQIYLKCGGGQWPCIINSSSLQQAKVIIGTSSGIYSIIVNKKEQHISVVYCFYDQNNEPVQFFVTSNVVNIQPYQESSELALLTLEFTQRPPDDLILKIGEFIEVNENFKTRKEERIALNENSMRQLCIPKEESYIFIAGVPRKCIMKDISFGGARVMLVGVPKFLEGKTIDLRLYFTDTDEKVSLIGKILKAEFLQGRKDISVVHIQFNQDEIPMAYKFHINNYITSYQKQLIEKQINNQAAAQRAEQAAAEKVAQQKKVAEQKAEQAAAEKASMQANIKAMGTAFGATPASQVKM